ncbi:MAG: class II aldolase/adducin family protein [Oscillospiraceae bacterium]|nr:class II aldolase/adducin family protein [Oscillospiraceae bacterium]
MLEKLKAEVILAYQELNRYGLNAYSRGIVSGIDRESGYIVMKSAKDALITDLQGNVIEGAMESLSEILSHIAIYQAFPKLGGIVRPHARFATIFAQTGMDIPVLGSFHKDLFHEAIPCADSATDVGSTFRQRHMDALQTPATLVACHSAYAWGATVLDAVTNAAALEETANMAYHTMQLDPGILPMQ